MAQRWPAHLWIVRHGESAGNVAAAAADEAGHPRIKLDIRDADVPLSNLGVEQAEAVARWFANLDRGPEIILASPFLRARETARLIAEHSNPAESPFIDERLREREFGILDRLTRRGVEQLHPDQAAALSALGKFYHRPPGGESWVDVILRLRAFVDTISLHHAGDRVVIVAHQVVVLCLRYILESFDEATILGIDRAGDIANCSVTEYDFVPDDRGRVRPRLLTYNFVQPLDVAATPVTTAPDVPVAAG
ncbi:phosphoglycerate mutase [Polymorphobacter glacialis]|uniref:Phosphoglycerate mutase n=1 Tax=Sandarakinorhabdus glacialis TaxID=1614636 RepID=A0A916ZV89_9SPHN|nr:histidine phosphatase family protein [Polymorphobacter glacialis]GGE14935.1 phosphoglycerate mutase [Polymorphobacter glacialis]